MTRPTSCRIALLALALLAHPAHAAPERRCGWLWNPTPGNYFLKDHDAEWTISQQGQDDAAAADLDVMPDMTTGGWVETNGHYGYGCACITAEVNRLAARVLRLTAAEPLPLSRCRADRTLPPP